MRSRDFCYWLQGFFEIASKRERTMPALTTEQVECVQAHLALVFKHEIDPSIDGGDPVKKGQLDSLHGTGGPPQGTVYRC